jgi:hypothetical protein
VGDFNASMRGQLHGNWRDEGRFSHRHDTSRRSRHGYEHRHEDGAIFILAGKSGASRLIALVLVSTPMRVDCVAVVMGSNVFVRMRVYKRSAQGRDLNGQHERYRYGFPHHRSIVGETAHRVKAPAERAISASASALADLGRSISR